MLVNLKSMKQTKTDLDKHHKKEERMLKTMICSALKKSSIKPNILPKPAGNINRHFGLLSAPLLFPKDCKWSSSSCYYYNC